MTKEELSRELSLVRAQQQQLRKQVLELGCKTAVLAKSLLDLDDRPPEGKRPGLLRSHLFGKQENQFQPGFCRTGRRHQRSARRHVAGQLYGL